MAAPEAFWAWCWLSSWSSGCWAPSVIPLRRPSGTRRFRITAWPAAVHPSCLSRMSGIHLYIKGSGLGLEETASKTGQARHDILLAAAMGKDFLHLVDRDAMLHGNGLHRLHVIDAFLIEFFLQAGTHGTDGLRRYPGPSCDLFATAFKQIKQSHGSAPRLITAQV